MSDRTPSTSDDDEIDIDPWPVSELVGRAAVFGALGQRLAMELNSAESEDVFDLETDRFELNAWARVELAFAATQEESDVLGVEVGRLSEDAQDRCIDAMIGASTLGWALRLSEVESLPIDINGELEQDVLTWAPAPWDQLRSTMSRARLRSDQELATEIERWEVVVWRLTLFEDPADRAEDDAALNEAVSEIAEAGLLAIVDGDIAIASGEPFRDLDEPQRNEYLTVAEIRLRALNWLCGLSPSWYVDPANVK